MYEGLPVVLVDDLADLSIAGLRRWRDVLSRRTYNQTNWTVHGRTRVINERLTNKWWWDQMLGRP